MPFCLAIALVYGKVAPEDFTDEQLKDARIQNLIRRTEHVPKEELTITFRDGRKLSEPFKPATNLTDLEQVRDKFAHSAGSVFLPKQTENIAEHVARLESLPSIGELTDLLRTR